MFGISYAMLLKEELNDPEHAKELVRKAKEVKYFNFQYHIWYLLAILILHQYVMYDVHFVLHLDVGTNTPRLGWFWAGVDT